MFSDMNKKMIYYKKLYHMKNYVQMIYYTYSVIQVKKKHTNMVEMSLFHKSI